MVVRRRARRRRIPPRSVFSLAASLLLAGAFSNLLIVLIVPAPSLHQFSGVIPMAQAWTGAQGTQGLAWALPLRTGNILSTIAILGLVGIFAVLFCWIAIRLFSILAGRDLLDVLKGNEPVSPLWLYILALGIVVGAGLALFFAFAVAAWSPPLEF